MMKNRNIVKGLIAIVMMVGVVACAVIAGPPQELVVKNDHGGLENWYAQEAVHLRQRAKDMLVMAEAYQKNPGPTARGVVSSKIDMIQHCQNLAAIYAKAAEEADAMAAAHRDMKGLLKSY